MVEFGTTENDYRNISLGNYTSWESYTEIDGMQIDFPEVWKNQEVKIDYAKITLFCSIIPYSGDSALYLNISDPVTENLDLLGGLCFFYYNNIPGNTVFTIEKSEDVYEFKPLRVGSLEELLKNLHNNVTIELDPGMYNISELDNSTEGEYFRWAQFNERS